MYKNFLKSLCHPLGVCPFCGSLSLHRLPRKKKIDAILSSALQLFPWQCERCGRFSFHQRKSPAYARCVAQTSHS